MRDGATLIADVLLPDAEGPFPTILVRTPYGRESALGAWAGDALAQRGSRSSPRTCAGKGDSEGTYDEREVDTLRRARRLANFRLDAEGPAIRSGRESEATLELPRQMALIREAGLEGDGREPVRGLDQSLGRPCEA